MKIREINNINITIFGDSIPKGIVYLDDKIQIAENCTVNILESFYNIKINNKSAYGQTLIRIVERQEIEKYISSFNISNKNVVFMCVGGNDSDYNWKEVEKSPEQNHCSKTSISEFAETIEKTVLKLKNNNVEVFLCTLVPIDSNRYMENMISKIANPEKIMAFLNNDVTNISRHQELFNNEIIKCAIKHNCPLLDIRSKFLMKRDYLDYYCIDGVHPNLKGQKFLAEKIVEDIEKIDF
ncbi:MAG: SGNH/GDSL hydrolase family protein [Clostridia bacterium]